mmetsp:Transcript_32889/g.71022  ORF Transcript_32889/g.71022 Transcript_32889/m.71022 type:complete len:244 (+) Transcript_32889:354-1085(+)
MVAFLRVGFVNLGCDFLLGVLSPFASLSSPRLMVVTLRSISQRRASFGIRALGLGLGGNIITDVLGGQFGSFGGSLGMISPFASSSSARLLGGGTSLSMLNESGSNSLKVECAYDAEVSSTVRIMSEFDKSRASLDLDGSDMMVAFLGVSFVDLGFATGVLSSFATPSSTRLMKGVLLSIFQRCASFGIQALGLGLGGNITDFLGSQFGSFICPPGVLPPFASSSSTRVVGGTSSLSMLNESG